MKSNSFKPIGLLFFLFFCFSCSKDPDYLDVNGGCQNPIEISQNAFEITAEGGYVEATLESQYWFISAIYLNGSIINFDRNIIDLDVYTISNDEFRLQRVNDTLIRIEMTENSTQMPRELLVGLHSGNCHTSIKILQAIE